MRDWVMRGSLLPGSPEKSGRGEKDRKKAVLVLFYLRKVVDLENRREIERGVMTASGVAGLTLLTQCSNQLCGALEKTFI